ncbi:hypothetical protein FRC09_006914 [Ceratobasidium sp. 395]|nr:hypothetical protein FRC09_006914 [Ceratobasidium sp. 395]
MDALVVVGCYVTRLSSGPPNLKLWFHLYEWAFGYVGPSILHLRLSFFQVSYAAVWIFLDSAKDPQPMTADRICDLVGFGGRLMLFTRFILETPVVARRDKDALLEIIHQSDIFALLVRLLLLRLAPVTFTQKDMSE